MKKISGFICVVVFLFLVCPLYSQVRIKMKKEGNIYTVPCTVNGLNLRFIFDTGASDVCLSLSEAIFMVKNGYLSQSDIIGSSKSTIADGSIVENTKVILREINIGGIVLKNVQASVMHNINAPLLLGQSAIQMLGGFRIEGNDLIIGGGGSRSQSNSSSKSSSSNQTTVSSNATTTNQYNIIINPVTISTEGDYVTKVYYYDENWIGVKSKMEAFYCKIAYFSKSKNRPDYFEDYYMSGELQGKSNFVKINAYDDSALPNH